MDATTSKYYNIVIDEFENNATIYTTYQATSPTVDALTTLPKAFILASISYYFGLTDSLSIN